MKNLIKPFSLAAWLLTSSLTYGAEPSPVSTPITVEKAIAVLQSDAPQKEKSDACLSLVRVGNKSAVPALAALLTDEKMAHMARYALETIPDASVETALRDALPKVKGRLLTGVIGSLGMRKDPQAVAPLAKLLQDADPIVVQASARAMGSIGTTAAASALMEALPKVGPQNQVNFCEGLLRCAEAITVQGHKKESMAIYDKLRTVAEAHQVRSAALRGAILVRGKEGLPLLLEALRQSDYAPATTAARVAIEMGGKDVVKALAGELPKLSADKQVLVISTLGKLGDDNAFAALKAATASQDKPVRLAAVRALPEIRNPDAVPVLINLSSDADAELAKAALECLAGFPGKEADKALLKMLEQPDTAKRLTAIELIAQRRTASALPSLMKLAGDTDEKIRTAATRKLGELADEKMLPDFIQMAQKATKPSDLDSLEQAMITLCANGVQPDQSVNQIVTQLPKTGTAQKGTLLRVLASIGNANALKAVRAAVDDPTPEIHAAALRALSEWRNADAAGELLALAKSAATPGDKMRCLRGVLRAASLPEVAPEAKLEFCKQAAALVQRDDEKKLLLSALSGQYTGGSLAMIIPYLEDTAVTNEAAAAVLALAEKMLAGKNAANIAPRLVTPLERIANTSTNASLKERAQKQLQVARSKTPGK
jgi:HEAT repeat protein